MKRFFLLKTWLLVMILIDYNVMHFKKKWDTSQSMFMKDII